jgi:hypothetical protein
LLEQERAQTLCVRAIITVGKGSHKWQLILFTVFSMLLSPLNTATDIYPAPIQLFVCLEFSNSAFAMLSPA